MLLEFALTMGILWMLVAGTIELGRMVAAGHLIQGAARSAARALALDPAAVNAPFVDVVGNVFDPDYLVIDVQACEAEDLTVTELVEGDAAAGRPGLPMLNQLLLPLMIREDRELDGVARRLARYPGTLVRHRDDPPDKPCATAYTVAVPELRSAGGSTDVCWHAVVEEFGVGGPGETRFPLGLGCTSSRCGLAGLEVRFPFQSAAFPAWRETGETRPDGRPRQRVAASNEGAPGEPITDPVGGAGTDCPSLATAVDTSTAALGALGEPRSIVDPYGGPLGLGSLRVLPEIASGPSRAYRKVLTGSAVYPREGFL